MATHTTGHSPALPSVPAHVNMSAWQPTPQGAFHHAASVMCVSIWPPGQEMHTRRRTQADLQPLHWRSHMSACTPHSHYSGSFAPNKGQKHNTTLIAVRHGQNTRNHQCTQPPRNLYEIRQAHAHTYCFTQNASTLLFKATWNPQPQQPPAASPNYQWYVTPRPVQPVGLAVAMDDIC